MPTHQSAMTVNTATDDQGEHDTGRCSGVVAPPEYLGQPAGHVAKQGDTVEQLVDVGAHLIEVSQQWDHFVVHRVGQLR